MKWFYSRRGNFHQHGVVDESTLRKLAKQQRILPDDLVWPSEQDSGWVPARSIDGLFPVRPVWSRRLVGPLAALVTIGLLGWGVRFILQMRIQGHLKVSFGRSAYCFFFIVQPVFSAEKNLPRNG